MRAWCAVLVGFAAAWGSCDVSMPSVFSSHMVLQQSSKVAVFGTADPGESVTAVGSWGKSATTVASRDGNWSVRLQTPGPGGPHWLKVRGKNVIVFSDVLTGEVWVCSGQSNMWWPLGPRAGMTAVAGGAEEVLKSANPRIRLFTVPLQHSETPLTDVSASWQPCVPATTKDFSAVGYFFGKALQARLDVPVGLIQTAYGGTPVEQWMRAEALFSIPGMSGLAGRKEAAASASDKTDQILMGPAGGAGFSDPATEPKGYEEAKPDTDAAFWEGFDGVCAYIASFTLDPSQTGQGCVIELGTVDDWDLTALNGTRVGGTKNYAMERRYSVPPGSLRAGTNRLGVLVVDTGGAAGFGDWGKVRVTVGGKNVPLTGWKRKQIADRSILMRLPVAPRLDHSTLWNAMVRPLVPFSIRGAIWYQGESNVTRAAQYATSFPAMIQDWRRVWGQGDFPFYFVQIAPFAYANGLSPELREAQFTTMRTVKNSGMVVVGDLVENVRDIHPAEKREVGRRLSLWALTNTYHRQGFPCSGPVYDGYRVDGKTVRIRFDYAQGGLSLAPGVAFDIKIAGDDKKFVAAEHAIEGETLVVWSDQVREPKAVRYGWSSDMSLTPLKNVQGLPASPFRTDGWPLATTGQSW